MLEFHRVPFLFLILSLTLQLLSDLGTSYVFFYVYVLGAEHVF